LGGGGLLVGAVSSSFMLAQALSASIFGRLSDTLNHRAPFIRTGILLFFLLHCYFYTQTLGSGFWGW
jgi:MFS family permease